ncbi:MAG: ATP-binding cassette domain-containing protein [Elusimicrobia bacterium]|nr:ATP-binding cassette domain-containing protein [Elusimicrobiota bacterium]
MITLRHVRKEFGSQTLFKDISLQINDGDRLALVGPNGAGKSTLFKMLLGQEEPDRGEVQIRNGAQVGYLPQERAKFSDGHVLDETLAYVKNPDGRVVARAKGILMGLGFKIEAFDKSVDSLSGGWAMRVAIARLLAQEPDLLLLDEPTNHLDLDSLLWFQEYLRSYHGAIFLISHDRSFVNAVCRGIVGIEDHDLKLHPGSFEHYVQMRQAERERLEASFARQQEEIERMQEFVDRNRARASTAGRAQSMIKRMEKIIRIELPPESKKVRISFPQPQRTSIRVMTLKNVQKSYGALKVYQGLDFELERGWKMAFVGHNGAGKSTLLKMLAGVVEIDSGERQLGLNVKVGYYSQHRTDMLQANRTALDEAYACARIGQTETFIRTVLGTFLFPGDSVFKKTDVLSGGEKSRLALVKLLLDPPNVLLMDEPTTHLDMASVEALVEALRNFEGTLCLISHDLYFINSLASHVVHVDQGRVRVYPGNYEYFQRRQEQSNIEAAGLLSEPKPLPSRAQQRDQVRRSEKIQTMLTRWRSRIAELAKEYENPTAHSDFARLKAIGDEIRMLQEKIRQQESHLQGETDI